MDNLQFTSPYEWNDFCDYLLKQNRYVLNEKWARFIKTILETAKKRKHPLPKNGVVFWRARIASKEEGTEEFPLPRGKMGAPPSEKAREGRINPKGISYLYLANNYDTAISEVRPWLKQRVTVGGFISKKDLTLIDISKDKQGVWGDINNSFSRPVSVGQEHRYYVPTQYLAEYFKNEGYDGIIYKSSLTKTEDGHNFVFFDPNVADLRFEWCCEIKSIKYNYQECEKAYALERTPMMWYLF